MSETSLKVDVDVRTELPASFPAPFEPFLVRVLTAAARHEGISGEVSVSLVSDEEIHDLNRLYRNVDRPTDVLSFAMTEGDDEFPEVESVEEPLGDIVISVPTCLRQAVEYGHSVERELAFLLVHGFLHLVGYDHQDAEAERTMFGIQDAVLDELGIRRA